MRNSLIVASTGAILLVVGVYMGITIEESTGDAMTIAIFVPIIAIIWGISLTGIGSYMVVTSNSSQFGFTRDQRRLLLFGSVIIGIAPVIFLVDVILFSFEQYRWPIGFIIVGILSIAGAFFLRLFDTLSDIIKLRYR